MSEGQSVFGELSRIRYISLISNRGSLVSIMSECPAKTARKMTKKERIAHMLACKDKKRKQRQEKKARQLERMRAMRAMRSARSHLKEHTMTDDPGPATLQAHSQKRLRSDMERNEDVSSVSKKRKISALNQPDLKTDIPISKNANVESEVSDRKEDPNVNKRKIPFLLTFDTEVNGWKPLDENGQRRTGVDPQSRMAQIGWSVFTEDGELIESKSDYIKPTDWEVNEEQTLDYGITQKLVEEQGVPILDVLYRFREDMVKVQNNKGHFGSHNTNYDVPLIIAECNRLLTNFNIEIEHIVEELKSILENASFIDTFSLSLLKMLNENIVFYRDEQSAMNLDVSWNPFRKLGPKLGNLHTFLCGGNKKDKAHHAQYDAEMCGEVIFALKSRFNIDLFARAQ